MGMSVVVCWVELGQSKWIFMSRKSLLRGSEGTFGDTNYKAALIV